MRCELYSACKWDDGDVRLVNVSMFERCPNEAEHVKVVPVMAPSADPMMPLPPVALLNVCARCASMATGAH